MGGMLALKWTLLTLCVAFKRYVSRRGQDQRVMNDNTQDKRVWKGIIGVTRGAPGGAFYELRQSRRNHSLSLTSSQRLPGRGGRPLGDIPGKGVTWEEAWM